jgi:hypothetical protein
MTMKEGKSPKLPDLRNSTDRTDLSRKAQA